MDNPSKATGSAGDGADWLVWGWARPLGEPTRARLGVVVVHGVDGGSICDADTHVGSGLFPALYNRSFEPFHAYMT
jgi:hypothetical protein